MTKIKPYTNRNGKTYYMFRVYVGVDEKTGKKKYTTRRGFETKTLAKKALTDLKYKIDKEGVNYNKRRLETYEDVYELWLEQYINKVRGSTYKQVKGIFNSNIIPALGRYRIDQITPLMCQDLVNALYNKHKTYRKMVMYASIIFDYAKNKLEIIKKNPFNGVEFPKAKDKVINIDDEREVDDDEINFYTKDELQEFLEYTKLDFDKKVHVFFRLLGFSGLRKGEALALTWKDIDFENNTIAITKTLAYTENGVVLHPPKNKLNRILAMDTITMAILAAWKKEQKKEFKMMGVKIKSRQLVFSNRDNNFIALSKTTKWIARITSKHNFKIITTHDFRHTHCSLLLEADVSLKKAQDRMGHRDIQTTANIYAKLSKQIKRDVVDKFIEYVNF